MSTQKYIKQDPITHILTRPDMYVGSKGFDRQQVYIYAKESIIVKEVSVSPAIVRTFVEILSNAVDNIERAEKTMTYISVDLSATHCEIKNDGAVIPIEQNEVMVNNKTEIIYNHSLIFGHLLSGSNYDDTEKRYTSGRNGLGAKLTNVLSTSFTVEGVDPANKAKLVQTWTNNMRNTAGPLVSKSSRITGYTSIKWSWDCAWFGIKGLPQDTLDMLAWHVLNASMITGLKVTLNGTKLPNKLASYFDLLDGHTTNQLKLENNHSRVFVVPSTSFEAISFVNGIQTKNGGKHVNAWVDAVCRPVMEKLRGRGKAPTALTIKDIKPYFKFLVVTRIPNPEFESQEKNELKTPVKADPITSYQVAKIMKWPIGETLKGLMLSKEKKQVTKAIAATAKHPVIDGYDKANNAGGTKAKDCTLIVCEGLSAKTFAVDGISRGLDGKKGRDWFGIFPLRGKMLNTRNATPTSIKNNAVITNLMKVIGLDYGNPDKLERLNYGRLCIITDADVDGIHIEGLILNFFHSLFPKLLKRNFIISMKTPILRVGKTYYFDERSATTAFQNKGTNKVKYYKGLGAIEPKETDKVFGIKMLQFEEDKDSDRSFITAFDKAESAKRKEWLAQYNPLDKSKLTLDDEGSMINFAISRHLNDELIKFFHDDCKRSIPNGLDGLKESQRKIVYAAKKCNLKSDSEGLKVAQFGADVAKHTNYHHGEENLFKTIIKMAQSFIGSNNIPLFAQNGWFGTRLEGGEDAASARYIRTKAVPQFNNLFNPLDDALLNLREDDGDLVEPYHYVPTIPLLLVNGCVGIGTGWMCNMPQFKPKDVATACQLWMRDRHQFLEFVNTMKPWYNGFTGEIEKVTDTKFQTKGIYTELNGVIHVTELPVGLWNSKFQKMLDEKELRYNNRSTPDKVDYEIFLDNNSPLFKDFEKKMCTSLNLDNIVVFDKNDKIAKVTLVELFDMWGEARLSLNDRRKAAMLADLDKRSHIATCKNKFIRAVRNKNIDVTSEETKIVDLIKSEGIAKEAADIKMLLDLPVRTLTEERRKELKTTIQKIAHERAMLEEKSNVDIWFEDMAKLEV